MQQTQAERATLHDNSRTGPHEGQEICCAVVCGDLKPEQVGDQQCDQSVALSLGARCVERALAGRGRQRKIVQRKVSGIVETSLVFVQCRIEKAT